MSIRYRVLLLAFLLTLASYVTLYTVAAYDVARYAFREDGAAYWGGVRGATFFPFPRVPRGSRGVGLDFMIRMNPVDEFIYFYMIETRVLIVISISIWILVAVYFVKAILPVLQNDRKTLTARSLPYARTHTL